MLNPKLKVNTNKLSFMTNIYTSFLDNRTRICHFPNARLNINALRNTISYFNIFLFNFSKYLYNIDKNRQISRIVLHPNYVKSLSVLVLTYLL
jgi:hypothetical protein